MISTPPSLRDAHLQFSRGWYRVTPRSIADRAYWNALQSAPQFATLREKVEKTCAEAPRDWPAMRASDYLAVPRRNDRSSGDRHINTNAAQLAALVLRRCLDGFEAPGEYDEQLLDWLWGFISEPSWAFSAHLKELPGANGDEVDLGVAMMGANLAEIWQSLAPWMDAASPRLGEWILRVIDERLIAPYASGAPVWWDGSGEVLNWLGVCAGGIFIACESLAALGHPRPAARKRALAGLNRYLVAGFTPGGECDEGLGYWTYGLDWTCAALSRLERAELESAIDIERLRLVTDYPRRSHLVGDLFFSGNDAGARCRASLGLVPWLAGATDSPWLWDWSERTSNATPGGSFSLLLRGITALERTEAQTGETSSPQEVAGARWLEDQQVAIVPVASARGELLATLTGGHNDERHNHNDLGHFTLILDEKIIVPDYGAPQPYPGDFFGPNRYSYLAASSRGHCCPIINGFEQRAGADAATKVVSWNAERGELTLELGAAYPPEAMLRSWTRTLRPDGEGAIAILDRFETRNRAEITQVFWSRAAVAIGDAARVSLGALECLFEPAPRALELQDAAENELKTYRVAAHFRSDDNVLETGMRFRVADAPWTSI